MDFSLTYDITQIALSVSIFNSHFHSPQYQFQTILLVSTYHLICMPLNLISSSLTFLFALCNTKRCHPSVHVIA